MSAFSVAKKLWFRTVFLNAMFVGISMIFSVDGIGILLAIGILTVGYVVTLPLLLLIVPVIKISQKLPYNTVAKIAWVACGMVVIIVLFYTVFGWIIGGVFYAGTWLTILMDVTIGALLTTVWWIRKSFITLYTSDY
jgi:hypothetical protein